MKNGPNHPLHQTGAGVSCSLKSAGRLPRQVSVALGFPMIGWLRDFLVPPRRMLLGRLRNLRGRTPDAALCQVPGVDQRCTDRALKLVCGAFLIPAGQQYCLRPGDALRFIYLGGHKRRLCDDMEFESLFLGLGEAVGRPLSELEMKSVQTVEDVVRFLKEHEQVKPSAAPDRSGCLA
jgi:hypothetical protein